MKRPIATTARTHSRMGGDEIARLKERLAPWQPDAANWQAEGLEGVELEIGIGNGLAMLERARTNPHILYVGCEVYLNGLKTILHRLKTEPLPNICLTDSDVRLLLEGMPHGCLDRVVVPFPDPWPKSRHHKRRLVQPQLLDACARVLKSDGEMWVITDWPSYAYHSIAVLHGHARFRLAQTEGAAADCKPAARLEDQLGPHHLSVAPAWWVETKYQQKAATAGRKPWFIKAVKNA